MKLATRIRLRKINPVKKIMTTITPVTGSIVFENDHVDIVQMACKECYKGKLCDTIEQKLRYISSKVKLGHESVLEHSNVVILLEYHTTMNSELDDIITASKLFLDFQTKTINDITYLLVGGSIAGFKRLIQRVKDIYNPIVQAIVTQLYRLDKEYFLDFIQDGVMDEALFMEPELIHHASKNTLDLPEDVDFMKDKMDIVNFDSIVELYENTHGIFTYPELAKFVSVTVYIKDMARVITQMVTRHRNAISQKSQRYVDETGASYVNPISLNRQEYIQKAVKAGSTEEEAIEMVNRLTKHFDDKLTMITALYDELRADNFVNKEDARYLLPNATKSSLFVTFNLINLIHFCKVRDDIHAQKEVRLYGTALKSIVDREVTPIIKSCVSSEYTSEELLKDDKVIYTLLEPAYTSVFDKDADSVDEVVNEKEEVVTTDDAYEKMKRDL